MELTQELKDYIDSLDHYELLHGWRFHHVGDPLFQDESGEYWGKRMYEKRQENPTEAVQDSKLMGW